MRMCASNALSKIVCAVAESNANDSLIRLCSMGRFLLRVYCQRGSTQEARGPSQNIESGTRVDLWSVREFLNNDEMDTCST